MVDEIIHIACDKCRNFCVTIKGSSPTSEFLRHFIPVHDDKTGEEYYVCQACGASVPMEQKQ